MSLGDGLARGLKRYLEAKRECGLKSLILGEAAIDASGRPKLVKDKGPNGNGNGHRNGHRLGDAAAEIEIDRPGNPTPSMYEAHGIQWQQTQYKVRCPDCQVELRFSEGCMTCDGCGFSKC